MPSHRPASITVLTSITGGKDKLQDEQTKGAAQWWAYLDTPRESPTWEIKPAYNRFADPRRNSRAPKILSHLFCNTEYSIWLDGTMILTKKPEDLIAKYLANHDIALFKHNKRDCLYDEARKCAFSELDDPEVIIEQAKKYEDAGYEKNKGLYECGMILRRHTPQVIALNNYWWSHYTRYSNRDQISFPFAVDSVGVRVNAIEMNWQLSSDGLYGLRGNFVKMAPHIIRNPLVL